MYSEIENMLPSVRSKKIGFAVNEWYGRLE
jgi:hypothetical protein